jgi:hypothetical protein
MELTHSSTMCDRDLLMSIAPEHVLAEAIFLVMDRVSSDPTLSLVSKSVDEWLRLPRGTENSLQDTLHGVLYLRTLEGVKAHQASGNDVLRQVRHSLCSPQELLARVSCGIEEVDAGFVPRLTIKAHRIASVDRDFAERLARASEHMRVIDRAFHHMIRRVPKAEAGPKQPDDGLPKKQDSPWGSYGLFGPPNQPTGSTLGTPDTNPAVPGPILLGNDPGDPSGGPTHTPSDGGGPQPQSPGKVAAEGGAVIVGVILCVLFCFVF